MEKIRLGLKRFGMALILIGAIGIIFDRNALKEVMIVVGIGIICIAIGGLMHKDQEK